MRTTLTIQKTTLLPADFQKLQRYDYENTPVRKQIKERAKRKIQMEGPWNAARQNLRKRT